MIRLEIWNDGSGNTEVGSYDIILSLPGETHEARVENFDRNRGAIPLLREAVKSLEGPEFLRLVMEMRLATVLLAHDCEDAANRLEMML